jgi:hypothetical protein
MRVRTLSLSNPLSACFFRLSFVFYYANRSAQWRNEFHIPRASEAGRLVSPSDGVTRY